MWWHLRFISCFGTLPAATGLPGLCGDGRFPCAAVVLHIVSGEGVLRGLHVSCAVVLALVLQGGPCFETEVLSLGQYRILSKGCTVRRHVRLYRCTTRIVYMANFGTEISYAMSFCSATVRGGPLYNARSQKCLRSWVAVLPAGYSPYDIQRVANLYEQAKKLARPGRT